MGTTHSADWEEIFGPTPIPKSKPTDVEHCTQTLIRTRRTTGKLQGLRDRLVQDDDLRQVPAFLPSGRPVYEAQIISRNAEAMLEAVSSILEERVARRLEEENRIRWPWPDVIRVKPVVPPRPTARSRAEFRRASYGAEGGSREEMFRREGRGPQGPSRHSDGITSRETLASREPHHELGEETLPRKVVINDKRGPSHPTTSSSRIHPPTPTHIPDPPQRNRQLPATTAASPLASASRSISTPSTYSQTSPNTTTQHLDL